MDVIKVENATKKFGSNRVLNQVYMSFEKGKITGIVGRNGSGKTVLFKCICGFYCLDSGDIIYDNNKLKNGQILDEAGIIIENPAFLEKYNGLKNLELLYCINNKVDKAYLAGVMKSVGLEPKSRKKVSKYSMGMKQRLAIAQATMENKDILILDEPMNGLDAEGVDYFRRYFQELKENGKTLILASHNKDDISMLCDKVYTMENGEVVSMS
ncbi:MAG: ABC transporter ATP-binding protein [Lachnospiraceae bacterium]|nr:ABC transporter ATP-binding protein [Lachnospiraceae bacterium]